MISKEHLRDGMYAYGRNEALRLREAAPGLTDTEVIAKETFIPEWRPGVQAAHALVRRAALDQVYRVIEPGHDSTANPDWTPEAYPALFSICHTTDPAKAKPWAAPQGTSGMYQAGECYIDAAGQVWRQIYDGGNVYDAAAMPERWERA